MKTLRHHPGKPHNHESEEPLHGTQTKKRDGLCRLDKSLFHIMIPFSLLTYNKNSYHMMNISYKLSVLFSEKLFQSFSSLHHYLIVY